MDPDNAVSPGAWPPSPSWPLACWRPAPAAAGPPFVTDDPVPVDLHHWEVYGFSAATHVAGDTAGTAAGIEVNYGAAPNLQLHVIVPLAFDRPWGGPTATGLGDVELGVKYRLDPAERRLAATRSQ